jgi:hypothetical protein
MEIKGIAVRPFLVADRPFIFASFLNAYYYGNILARVAPVTEFWRFYNNKVAALVDDPGVTVSVACADNDPNLLLGMAITQGEVIHFVFVKEPFRLLGIAKLLLGEGPHTAYSHLTRSARDLVGRMKYTPYLL